MKSVLKLKNHSEKEILLKGGDGAFAETKGRILGAIVLGIVEVLGCSKGEMHSEEKSHVEKKGEHEAHDYRGLFHYDVEKKLYPLSEINFPCLAEKGNATFQRIGHCDKFKNGFLLIEKNKDVRFQSKDGSLEKFPVKVDGDVVIESIEINLPNETKGLASANFKIRH